MAVLIISVPAPPLMRTFKDEIVPVEVRSRKGTVWWIRRHPFGVLIWRTWPSFPGRSRTAWSPRPTPPGINDAAAAAVVM